MNKIAYAFVTAMLFSVAAFAAVHELEVMACYLSFIGTLALIGLFTSD